MHFWLGGPPPLSSIVSQRFMNWKHFWSGFAVGAALGAYIGFNVFENRLASIGLTAGVALFLGFCSGRWGSEFWGGLFDSWS